MCVSQATFVCGLHKHGHLLKWRCCWIRFVLLEMGADCFPLSWASKKLFQVMKMMWWDKRQWVSCRAKGYFISEVSEAWVKTQPDWHFIRGAWAPATKYSQTEGCTTKAEATSWRLPVVLLANEPVTKFRQELSGDISYLVSYWLQKPRCAFGHTSPSG